MLRQDSFNAALALMACLVMTSGANAEAADQTGTLKPLLIAQATTAETVSDKDAKEAAKAEQKAEDKAEKVAEKAAKKAAKEAGDKVEAKTDDKEVQAAAENSAAAAASAAASKAADKAANDTVKHAQPVKAPAPTVKAVSGTINKTGKAPKAVVTPAAKKQQQTDQKMVSAANQIDGVNVDPEIFKAEKKGFKLGNLNPIKWIFKPIIDMQKQVVHLQKQIMRLEAPIAALQKPMVGLRQDMVGVQEQMGGLRTDIGGIHEQMSGVDTRLGRVEIQLNKIYKPVSELKAPVIGLQKPVQGVNAELQTLKTDLKDLKDVVSLTSTLILVAVIGVGLLIVVGTPVAALFAWRHRRTIMQKLGEDTSGKAEPLDESPKEKREAVAGRR